MGAAIIGAVGVGEFRDFDEVTRFVKVDREIKPNGENKGTYRKLYKLFSESYEGLKEVFYKMT